MHEIDPMLVKMPYLEESQVRESILFDKFYGNTDFVDYALLSKIGN